MASEATKMAVIGIMHMDSRVVEFADFKYEVKFVSEGTEAIRRLQWPGRPPKWLLMAICTWISG